MYASCNGVAAHLYERVGPDVEIGDKTQRARFYVPHWQRKKKAQVKYPDLHKTFYHHPTSSFLASSGKGFTLTISVTFPFLLNGMIIGTLLL